MSTDGNTGPVGEPRGIGFGILLYVITLGFYGWYWAFKTQDEMRKHTGDGVGGVLGLVIWILLTPVSAFLIPSEVGKMYARAGRTPPMTGWTGLWLFPGAILIIPADRLVREGAGSAQPLLGVAAGDHRRRRGRDRLSLARAAAGSTAAARALT